MAHPPRRRRQQHSLSNFSTILRTVCVRAYVLKVAHSAEEAMDMILEDYYQVAVVDLHMPRMSGTEFCRRVRAHELEVAAAVRSVNINGRAGQEGEELNEPQPSTKLLLHTTSAGSVTFDELEVCTRGLIEDGGWQGGG